MTSVFRPRFGQSLAIAVVVLCAAALIVSAAHDGPGAFWTVGPWLALVSLTVWAVYWVPRVVVDDAGVHLVNVTRTIDLPWPAIRSIDTKWSLTLITAYGKYAAWAAPAPGGLATARAANRRRRLGSGVDDEVGSAESLRAGDMTSSTSGSAAAAIRERLDELHAAGHLDNPRLESDRAPVTWHWPMIAGVAALAVLSGLALLTG